MADLAQETARHQVERFTDPGQGITANYPAHDLCAEIRVGTPFQGIGDDTGLLRPGDSIFTAVLRFDDIQ